MESKKNQLNTLNLQYQRAKQARDIHAAQMVEKYGSKLWFMYKHFGKEIPESFDEDLQLRKNYNHEVDIIKKQIEKLKQEIQRENSIQTYRQKQNEDNSLFSAAIEEYGVTNDFSVCGYILPDGQMLCFGSSGIRDTDHRNIQSVYKEVGIVVNGDNTDYLIDFMQRGVIRFMPECTGFNMCIEPTNDQYACIKDICRSVGGEVMVDFDDNNGKTVHGVRYNSVNPQRLVADIYRYFNEGIKPFGDTNESKIKSGRVLKESVDMSMVGQVNYSWDFDEDEYNEYLQENGLENNQKVFEEYINDYVEFEIEYLDNDTFHTMNCEYLNYYDVIENFGEKMAMKMVRDCQTRGEGSFETYELYDENVDINNPKELNDIAVKLLQHGKYYKDCRGFILTNGEVVYTPSEHNQCTIIDGVKGTFHFISLGNIRVLQQSIDLSKAPTKEQREVLRKVIASYSDSELYLDIMTPNGDFSAKYINPDWRFVLAEIDRYFQEGIKPQGRQRYYESLKIIKKILKEEVEKPSIKVSGGADDFDLYYNDIKVARYFYTDNDAYPVLIFKGETYIGKPGSIHKDIVCEMNGYGNYNGFEAEMEGMDEYEIDEQYHVMKYSMEDEDPNMLEGRIWLQPKRKEVPYAILYFWGLMGYNALKSFKRNVDEICYKLDVDTNKLLICIADQKTGDWEANVVKYNDWSGVVPQITDKQKELKAIHNLPPEEKHKKMKGWMGINNKVINDKLAYRDHDGNIRSDKEPMTMAQYHSLIYQESKKNTKNIIISEEQYNRLFMKKNEC